jgi:imidazolonepropionase-like amidohydrolase
MASPIRRCILPCFVLVLLACCSLAQSTPANIVLLHCNRLLDVRQGTYLTNAVVLIQEEKIVSVGSGNIPTPAGARVIDAPGTCLPGLIDVHVHLTSDPEEGGFGYVSLGVSIPRETIFGAKNARKTLMSGFTTSAMSARTGTATSHCVMGSMLATCPGRECRCPVRH